MLVLDLYSAYSGLTSLAISPSGNYNTFTEAISTKANEVIELYDKLDSQIPEIFELENESI
ncbi:MAG: hypothetical protein GX069_05975 [Tissierellia bacterium]|nr:hypothetical protein [Tissierellia bacterium]